MSITSRVSKQGRGKSVPALTQTTQGSASFFLPGASYFIRTVTYHHVGRVREIVANAAGDPVALVLEDAAWVADSGRFTQAICDGSLLEVEPVGLAYVNLGAVCDAFPWPHTLPVLQK